MKKIVKITRITTKILFKDLKNKSPIFCGELNQEIKVDNLFLKHINGEAKDRKTKEVILRLLTIPLIEKILKDGKIIENRDGEKFLYYKIELEKDGEFFRIVLSKNKKTGIIYLFSSFIK